MMLEKLLHSPLAGGLIGAVMTIGVLKADVAWIKQQLASQDSRITYLERVENVRISGR